jgi:putative ABC transport system permease protein
MAWRESRAPRRLVLLVASVSAGVAALVAINSFTDNLQDNVRDQARSLLGADLGLGSASAFSPRAEGVVTQIRAAVGENKTEVSRVVSFSAMAYVARAAGTRLVQVTAIEGGYPFYGRIETSPPGLWPRLGEGGGVLVDPSLLTALDAQVGDELSLGEARLVIRGVVTNFPGDVAVRSAFGPRVFMSRSDVERTGLVRFGSRARHEAFVKLPEGTDALKLAERHRATLATERVSIRTVSEDQVSLNRSLGRMGRFLGLVGLVALLLGGVGVGSAVRALIRRRMDSIAVLRCLGATARQIFAAYLVQAVGLALVGSLIGAAAGLAIQAVLPALVKDFLPVEVAFAPSPRAVLAGILLGGWVAGMFSLLPLLGIRDVSPLAVLRRPFEPPRHRGRDPRRLAAALLLAAGVVLVACLQAPNLFSGLIFAAAIGTSLAALAAAALLLTRGIRRFFPTRWPYVWRQGLANLHRPANQTLVVVLALGFGAFLLNTLYLVHYSLLRDLHLDASGTRPNLALFDIQPDQKAPVEAELRKAGLRFPASVPIIPMRITGLKGRSAAAILAEVTTREDAAGPSRWTLRREYRSTYRDTLTSSETLLAGERWAPGSWKTPRAGEPVPVSLDMGVARELGVSVGDEILWDVQGVEVRSRVANLRDVEWVRFEPNFFVVFPEGPLDAAPQTYVTVTRVEDATARARLQRQLIERYPNVSAVDLSQIQHAIETIVGRVTVAIRFMALFSLAAGVVVLLGAVAANRDQRIREGVLLKVLGATRAQVLRVILAEYLTLGSLAALAGLGLALLAGWALLRFLFEAPFSPPALALAGLSGGVVLLTAVVGAWSARDVFGRPSLESLRSE